MSNQTENTTTEKPVDPVTTNSTEQQANFPEPEEIMPEASQNPTQTETDIEAMVDTQASDEAQSSTVATTATEATTPETPNPFKPLVVQLHSLAEQLLTKGDDYKNHLQRGDCDKYLSLLREFFNGFEANYARALQENQVLASQDTALAQQNFDAFIASFNNFLMRFDQVAEFNLAQDGEEIATLSMKRDYYQEQLNSVKAKYDRLVAQQQTAKNYAAEKLVKNALKPFFQNMDNALKHLHKEEDNQEFKVFVDKLEAFRIDFFKRLAENNLEVFGAVGDEFDPNFHNALSMVPAPDPTMHNKLAFVSSQGYKLHDRVVVPADVMVFFDPAQS